MRDSTLVETELRCSWGGEKGSEGRIQTSRLRGPMECRVIGMLCRLPARCAILNMTDEALDTLLVMGEEALSRVWLNVPVTQRHLRHKCSTLQ